MYLNVVVIIVIPKIMTARLKIFKLPIFQKQLKNEVYIQHSIGE